MRSFLICSLCLTIGSPPLKAADPPWRTKPPAQWTEDDAKELLSSSPWVREVTAVVTRRLTEDQLREGGQMGQPQGVGNEGVDPKGSGPKLSPNILTGAGGNDRSARSFSRPIKLSVRWETALPVSIAELKSHEVAPPTLDGNGYRVAVYGIPFANLQGDPKKLGEPLKNLASLKREGKKDVRPLSVEVFQRETDMVVVYLFPSSAEITKKDQRIQFDAHIGRIVLSQNFELSQMEFQGKLEL
jgi:hypothetical protein